MNNNKTTYIGKFYLKNGITIEEIGEYEEKLITNMKTLTRNFFESNTNFQITFGSLILRGSDIAAVQFIEKEKL